MVYRDRFAPEGEWIVGDCKEVQSVGIRTSNLA